MTSVELSCSFCLQTFSVRPYRAQTAVYCSRACRKVAWKSNVYGYIDTFKRQTAKFSGDGCWEWPGVRTDDGYGAIRRLGVPRRAHRVSYEVNVGPIPAGMLVCHRCDNPPCVNPGHLFLGTHRDNIVDMAAKGRSRTVKRILSDEEVANIRAMLASGTSQADVARMIGVHPSNISLIGRWKTRRVSV